MNLIMVWRSARGTRHVALSPALLLVLAVSVAALLAGSFGLGFGLARTGASVAGTEQVDGLEQELAAQRASVEKVRDNAQDRLEALAIRLGSLNAHVIRLNALGARLASMAKLDDGEFDFSESPAIGGPEEPETGSVEMPGLTDGLDDLGARLDRQEQQLSLLANLLVDRKLSEDSQPRGRPVKVGYVSSYFGRRADPFTGQPRFHRGMDFAAKSGAEIVAVASGVVTWTGWRRGYGQMVEITHGNGYVTRYAHNARNLVARGDHVQQGETIALMGSTGRATGSNLHFEVWQNGRVVDPGRLIRKTS